MIGPATFVSGISPIVPKWSWGFTATKILYHGLPPAATTTNTTTADKVSLYFSALNPGSKEFSVFTLALRPGGVSTFRMRPQFSKLDIIARADYDPPGRAV